MVGSMAVGCLLVCHGWLDRSRLDGRSRFKFDHGWSDLSVPSFNTLRWTRFQFPRPLSMLSIDRVACVDPLVLVNACSLLVWSTDDVSFRSCRTFKIFQSRHFLPIESHSSAFDLLVLSFFLLACRCRRWSLSSTYSFFLSIVFLLAG